MLQQTMMAAMALWAALFLTSGEADAAELTAAKIAELSRQAIFGKGETSTRAHAILAKRGNLDVVPALVLALRFRRNDPAVRKSLKILTGTTLDSWKAGGGMGGIASGDQSTSEPPRSEDRSAQVYRPEFPAFCRQRPGKARELEDQV